MSRLRDERGFTLIELLVATTIGTIILMAAFPLVELAINGQVTTENRLEAVQRGRAAMEQVSRQVRSQTCIGRDMPPITDARDNSLTFYASVAPAPPNTDPSPIQRRTLTYQPYTDGSGRGAIVESVWTADPASTAPNLVFPASTRTDRRIMDDISPVPGTPIFRFYKYDPDTSPNTILLTPDATNGVAEADRKLVVQVRTTFQAWSTGKRDDDKVKTQLDSKILVRTADPTDPTRSPKCI